jgi:heme/copper-type cytochrome/quinol oxidase subunit 3
MMSAAPAGICSAPPIADLKLDEDLGKYGIWLLITTEAFLFITLFFSYFYLANRTDRWQVEMPPPLTLVLILLGILLLSSIVLHLFGEMQVKKEKYRGARAGIAATIVLGLIFLGLEGFAFSQSWPNITPATDSYGSIFYIIQFFHAAHVGAGVLMLTYVLFLPLGPSERTPHRPLHCAALYWHFVDVVWVFVVGVLFILPNLR